ncbi:MAG: histidine phosphatase family protein, partial [Acidobacteria bacterium]|nr:histidine phosphatase family protein [Acidobacteriota bacterium]
CGLGVVFAAAFVGSLLEAAVPAGAQEAIYIVRHAERLDDSKDSPLSDDGRARAGRLADVLRDAGITGIFVSEYQRAADTARPLATALGLNLQVIPADDQTALLAKVRAAGPRARVLIAGHSDTVPLLLKALGYDKDVVITKNEYDNLFVGNRARLPLGVPVDVEVVSGLPWSGEVAVRLAPEQPAEFPRFQAQLPGIGDILRLAPTASTEVPADARRTGRMGLDCAAKHALSLTVDRKETRGSHG